MIAALIFFYIIPTILSVFVILNKSDEVTVLDLIGIILISLMPLLNLIAGYAGGLIWFCQSEAVNNFLNKRIK
jgi:hypothetical protein